MIYDRRAYIQNGKVKTSDPILGFIGLVLKIIMYFIIFVILCVLHPLFAFVFLGGVTVWGWATRRRFGVFGDECPHCHNEIAISRHNPAVNCPICTKRVFVKNGQFIAV